MKTLGRLRPITDGELELIRSWRNHPQIASKMYSRHEISAEEHRAWWLQTSSRDDQIYYMYENSGEPLGVVGLTQIDLMSGNCFWAFYASPIAPRGTGSKMEFLVLEHVFGKLKLKKLSCEVLAFNEPVIRLHKKFGFQEEGVFRAHHKIDEDYMDVIRLGMLDTEWEEKRVKFASMFDDQE